MSMQNLPYARGMIRHADTSYGLPAPVTEYMNFEKYRDENDLYLRHVASPELDVGPNPKHKLYSRAMDFHRIDTKRFPITVPQGTGTCKLAREETRRRNELNRVHDDEKTHDAVGGTSRFHNNMPQTTVPTGHAALESSLAFKDIQAKLAELQKRFNELDNDIREAQQLLASCCKGHVDRIPIKHSGKETASAPKRENAKPGDSKATADTVAGGGVVTEGGSGGEIEKVGDGLDAEEYDIVGSDDGKQSDQMETGKDLSINWC